MPEDTGCYSGSMVSWLPWSSPWSTLTCVLEYAISIKDNKFYLRDKERKTGGKKKTSQSLKLSKLRTVYSILLIQMSSTSCSPKSGWSPDTYLRGTTEALRMGV